MKVLARLRNLLPAREPTDDTPWDGDTSAWMLSLLAHLGVLVALTLVTLVGPPRDEFLMLVSSQADPEDPLADSDKFTFSDAETDAIGASNSGDSTALVAVAPTLDVVAATPAQLAAENPIDLDEPIKLQEQIRVATGPKFSENLTIKGIAGVGVTGATGAIDRITQEILLKLEERKTLVVWMFDQSRSLEQGRAELVERFARVYEELGVVEASTNPAFKQYDDKPLLTAVVSFGQTVSFLTPKPTDNLDEIRSAVAAVKTDDSGIERVFTAVRQSAERFSSFRTQEPRRNVMFIIFTDEVGDDDAVLDDSVTLCRRHAIPVYCIGVPAPFGREEVLVRFVDPDPKFDQTPQWLPVRQGPESLRPELVKIGSAESDRPMASGFGPYGLTRLCVQTNGIFFAMQSDRRAGRRASGASTAELAHYFDEQTMRNYQPEYLPVKEYERQLAQNRARAALVHAAQMTWIEPMQQAQLYFPKVDEAELARRLSQAQRDAAVLEPRIEQLYKVLKQGEPDRPKLTTPRWQAGYDLSMGMVAALWVRTGTYNAILGKAKSNMKFKEPKSDTWVLAPSNEVSVGSAWEKLAAEAKTYLERVAREHPKTPWAVLAQSELKQPFSWAWKETYTGVNERRQAQNNRPQQPRDDKARMLPRPVKRPPPKL